MVDPGQVGVSRPRGIAMKLLLQLLLLAAIIVAVTSWASAAASRDHQRSAPPVLASNAGSSCDLPLSDTPEGAVRRMLEAYAGRRIDEYAAMLTDDYRFTSFDPDFAAAFPEGSSRADEIRM